MPEVIWSTMGWTTSLAISRTASHGVQLARLLVVLLVEAAHQLLEDRAHTVVVEPGMLDRVSRPREPPPRALVEPYVNVSAHTAPIIQPSVARPTDTSGQTTGAPDEQRHRASTRRGDDAV